MLIMNTELYNLAKKVGFVLKAKQLFIATAESCTGGLLAATLTEVQNTLIVVLLLIAILPSKKFWV